MSFAGSAPLRGAIIAACITRRRATRSGALPAMIRVTRSAIIDAPIERVWAILRDFNSHTAWHPVVAESAIENDEPSDQVGCVRNFTLKDGNHIREQLLALSDNDYISTYCILDATLPMQRYVATVQLKRVTDGDRTFWHWQSTFDTPRGREQEFADLVGKGVYEGGFEGLRAFLRRRPGAPAIGSAARAVGGETMATQGMVASRFGGPDVLEARSLEARAPGPGEVRIRHAAIGVNYIDVYVRKGEYRLIEPPAPHRHGSGRRGPGCRRRRRPSAAGRSRRLCLRAARRLCRRPHPAGEPGRRAAGRDRRGDGGGADAEGHDGRISPASHPPGAGGRDRPRPRGGGRRRTAALPVGQGPGRPRDRHRLHRCQGARRACRGLRRRHRRPRLPLRRRGARCHRPAAAPT